MKVFVIHRFKARRNASKKIGSINALTDTTINPIFLNSFGEEHWRKRAEEAINDAELIFIFDRASCEKSENATWEIEYAKQAGKNIIEIGEEEISKETLGAIKATYNHEAEFNDCFKNSIKNSLELYKIMISSSESLIERRQKTNAFFITVIGSLVAIAGFLMQLDAFKSETFFVLCGFSAIGILLCVSWRNLIDNYGKLNKAKFDVILRLEKELGAQIFSAEWISLGKGLRPSKYRSFTKTEKDVPLYFGILIIVLTITSIVFHIIN